MPDSATSLPTQCLPIHYIVNRFCAFGNPGQHHASRQMTVASLGQHATAQKGRQMGIRNYARKRGSDDSRVGRCPIIFMMWLDILWMLGLGGVPERRTRTAPPTFRLTYVGITPTLATSRRPRAKARVLGPACRRRATTCRPSAAETPCTRCGRPPAPCSYTPRP